jgi:hypothetical protein
MINMPPEINELILPVPPGFEQAMGYPGDRKWVAFFWTPFGDELEYDDGHSAGTIDWPACWAFTRHRLVRPLIRGYDFGSSENEAARWLLLDRQARRFYAGKKVAVAHFLQTFMRRFASESLELPPEQFETLAQSIKQKAREQRASIKFGDIGKKIAEKDRRVAELVRWLDDMYEDIMGGKGRDGGEEC